MKILITGVSGFIGSHIASAFVSMGHDVIGTYNSNRPRNQPIPTTKGNTEGSLSYIQLDIRDKNAIQEVCREVDGIINIAAHVLDWGNWDTFLASNVNPIQYFIDEFERNSIQFFIQTSSLTVYGFQHHRGTGEEGPYYPLDKGYWKSKYCNGYPRSKLLSEEILMSQAAKSQSTKIAVIRPGNVYGPGDTTVLYRIIKELLRENIIYVDNGRYLTSPIYISDLVQAYCLLFEQLISNPSLVHGRIYNITSDEVITWKEFFDTIADSVGLNRPKFSIPKWLSIIIGHIFAGTYSIINSNTGPLLTPFRVKGIACDYNFSIERAQRELNWTPATNFRTGIVSTVEAWREHAQT